MKPTINFYSEQSGEIKKFLDAYYSEEQTLDNELVYQKEFDSPIEMIDIISCFVDNNDKFNMTLWISLDENVYICITDTNINKLIKYIYERYPY